MSRTQRFAADCGMTVASQTNPLTVTSVSCENFPSKAPLGSGSPHWRDTYGSENLGTRRAPTDHRRTPAGAAAARAHRLETGGRGTGQVWGNPAGRGLQGRDAAQ